MEIYSAKWKSIQQNSIQQNGNLFSKTEIYSAKRESIQQNAGVAGVRTGIYSVKWEYLFS